MKKEIERLEQVVAMIWNPPTYEEQKKFLDVAVSNIIKEVIQDLRSPRREMPEQILGTGPFRGCIACKNWGKCLVDLDIINQELEPIPAIDRFGIHCLYYEKEFITPEQYQERTREPWPDNAAVYVLVRNKYIQVKDYRWETFSKGSPQNKCYILRTEGSSV
jgi:hypothetical protein